MWIVETDSGIELFNTIIGAEDYFRDYVDENGLAFHKGNDGTRETADEKGKHAKMYMKGVNP